MPLNRPAPFSNRMPNLHGRKGSMMRGNYYPSRQSGLPDRPRSSEGFVAETRN
jgi:hypothetical protein